MALRPRLAVGFAFVGNEAPRDIDESSGKADARVRAVMREVLSSGVLLMTVKDSLDGLRARAIVARAVFVVRAERCCDESPPLLLSRPSVTRCLIQQRRLSRLTA
jgi:hypothetical protein